MAVKELWEDAVISAYQALCVLNDPLPTITLPEFKANLHREPEFETLVTLIYSFLEKTANRENFHCAVDVVNAGHKKAARIVRGRWCGRDDYTAYRDESYTNLPDSAIATSDRGAALSAAFERLDRKRHPEQFTP